MDPTGYGAAPPGFGDQRNYELLLEAGFSATEVVQIMSLNGAKILGIDSEVGSIEAGKVADLVVIDADLEAAGNLRATDRIALRALQLACRDKAGAVDAGHVATARVQVCP